MAQNMGARQVGMVHAGVMETLTTDQRADAVSRPDGGVAVAVAELGPMIRRMARLARSLPTAPLDTGTGTSQYPGMHAACQAAFGDQARMCRLGTAEKLQISVYHPPLPPLGDGILQIAHSSWKGRRWLQSTKRFATNSTR